MKCFFQFIQLIYKIINYKDIALISSPSQLICLNELLYKKKYLDPLIIVGFPSESSIQMIDLISKKLTYIKNKTLNYLSKIIDEKKFSFTLKFLKFLFFFKSLIIGDLNYYHAKAFYKYCNQAIFLDEGINLLNFKDKNFSFDHSFFSIFNTFETNKIIERNEYDYLKLTLKNFEVNPNKIYLLGTSDAHPKIGALKNELYIKLINQICFYYSNKEIIFIPHRNELLENIEALKIKNLIVQKSQLPIELDILSAKELPGKFIGFYSMALINLRIILQTKNTEILNQNYDLNTLNNPNLIELYKLYQKKFNLFNIKSVNT